MMLTALLSIFVMGLFIVIFGVSVATAIGLGKRILDHFEINCD